MLYSFEPADEMPTPMATAAGLTTALAVYAAVMAVPLCATGAFVGFHFLVPGLVHVLVAVVFFGSRKGLAARRNWARWLVAVLSALVALALTIALIYSALNDAQFEVGIAIFWGIIVLCFASIGVLLSGPWAGAWFIR